MPRQTNLAAAPVSYPGPPRECAEVPLAESVSRRLR